MIIKLFLLILLLLIALAFAAGLVLRLQRTMEKVATLHQDLKTNNDRLNLEIMKLEKAQAAHEAAEAAQSNEAAGSLPPTTAP